MTFKVTFGNLAVTKFDILLLVFSKKFGHHEGHTHNPQSHTLLVLLTFVLNKKRISRPVMELKIMLVCPKGIFRFF